MARTGPANPGLADKLRALARDGIDYAEARVDLLRAEARDSGRRVGLATGLLIVAAITAHITLLGLMACLVVLARQSLGLGWLAAITIVAALNGLVTVVLALIAWRAASRPHFQATLGELQKDRSWLHENQPPTKTRPR